MTMIAHRTAISTADPFDLDTVKDHLRVVGEDDDADISAKAKTAAAEFEQVAQVALLTQTVTVTLLHPKIESFLKLPIGPVTDDASITVTMDGVALAEFDVIDALRPVLLFPEAAVRRAIKRLTVEYTAGFGSAHTDIPADIAEAIKDQTALHFDGRSPMDAKSLTSSPHMMRVAARYRGVQV